MYRFLKFFKYGHRPFSFLTIRPFPFRNIERHFTSLMIFCIVCIACYLSLFAPTALGSAASTVTATKPVTANILVVGDSLSASYGIDPKLGWVTLLQQKLNKEQYPYRVINLSTSGDTTSNGLEKLPDALKAYRPAVVILGLGSNDGLRGLAIPALKKNLSTMITLSKNANAKVLLIGFLIPPNYGPVYSEAFEQAFVDTAKKYQLQRVPFLLQNIALNPDLMQDDGLHPNEDAQPLILENVWPYLKKLL